LEEKLTGYKLELIFVDDGSKDLSLAILLDYQKRFPKQIKVVTLTRNFGTMAALQAGLTVASGDCVGVIAADLQDPPELFLEMIRHWRGASKPSLLSALTGKNRSCKKHSRIYIML